MLQSHCLLYCFSCWSAQQRPSWGVSSLKPCVPSSSGAQTSAWPPLCLLRSGRCLLLLRWGPRLGCPPGYPPAQSAWAVYHLQAYMRHTYTVSNTVSVVDMCCKQHSSTVSNAVSIVGICCKQHRNTVSNTVSILGICCKQHRNTVSNTVTQ